MRAGAGLAQESGFSVILTQDEFAQNLKPLPASPQLWAVRQKTLAIAAIKLRQCKLGELCWLATASRPDICARRGRIAPRVNSSQGSDVYRINDLAQTFKEWGRAAIPKYLPT